MELRESLRVVRRSWLVIVVVLAAAVAAGFVLLAVTTPTYEAETKLVFNPSSSSGTVQDQVQGNNLIVQRLPTYAELATTGQVLDPAIAGLGLVTTAADLADSIKATVSDKTALITITASADSAAGAANLANAVGAQLIVEAGKASIVNENGAVTGITGTVVESAAVPAVPSSPNRLLTLGVAVALGLALAFVVVVLREVLNTRVRNTTDLGKAGGGAPVIGSVPTDRAVRKSAGVLPADPSAAFVESFRQLRTRLHTLEPASPQIVVISSPGYAEGKSTVAAQFAIAIAEAGHNVTLVDANLRKPIIGSLFDVASSESLNDYLSGAAEGFKPATVEQSERLSVVTSTTAGAAGGDLLSSSRMASALEIAGRDAEIVIVDAGAIIPVADATTLAPLAGAYIVVARAGHTAIADLRNAVGSITEAGGTVLGVVLNRAAVRGPEAGR